MTVHQGTVLLFLGASLPMIPVSCTEKQKDPLPEWDITSNMEWSQMGFILANYIAPWTTMIGDNQWQDVRHSTLLQVAPYFQKRPDVDIVLGGPLFDGLILPRYFSREDQDRMKQEDSEYLSLVDMEIMVVALEKMAGSGGETYKGRIINYDLEADLVHPGYTLVCHIDSEAEGPFLIRTDNKVHLSSSRLVQEFQTGLQQQGMSSGLVADIFRHTLEWHHHHSHLVVSKWGTAVTLALSCPIWPIQAVEWKQRPRPYLWPPKHVVDHIISAGALLLPKAYKGSPWADTEWQFTFPMADIILADTLTPQQKEAFLLFKILVEHALEDLSMHLKASMLRQVLYWTGEQTAVLQVVNGDAPEGLAILVCEFIVKLTIFLEQHNLPHYILPENNLLDHLSTEVTSRMANKLVDLRKYPIQHLLAFDKQYKYPFTPLSMDYSEIMAPVMEEAKDKNSHQRSLSQYKALQTLFKVHLIDGHFSAMFHTAREALKRAAQVHGQPISLVELAQQETLALKPLDAAETIEHIIGSIPLKQTLQIKTLHAHLGCLYHTAAHTETGQEEKQQYSDKAAKAFSAADSGFSHKSGGLENYVKYLEECQGDSFTQWGRLVPHLLDGAMVISGIKLNKTEAVQML